ASVGHVDRTLRIGFRQDDHELLAAKAGAKIWRAADIALDAISDLAQTFVSGEVSGTVVELLEIIDVDQQQREQGFVSVRPAPFEIQSFVEGASIVHTGQAIERTQVAQHGIGFRQPVQNQRDSRAKVRRATQLYIPAQNHHILIKDRQCKLWPPNFWSKVRHWRSRMSFPLK